MQLRMCASAGCCALLAAPDALCCLLLWFGTALPESLRTLQIVRRGKPPCLWRPGAELYTAAVLAVCGLLSRNKDPTTTRARLYPSAVRL
jgi:hypothetical protein